MDNISVLKGPHNLDDSVAGPNMAKELIAQAFALAGAGYQSGNVYKSDGGRNDLFTVVQIGQFLKAIIGQRNNAGIRLDSGKRIVSCQNTAAGKRVEQGRFAD